MSHWNRPLVLLLVSLLAAPVAATTAYTLDGGTTLLALDPSTFAIRELLELELVGGEALAFCAGGELFALAADPVSPPPRPARLVHLDRRTGAALSTTETAVAGEVFDLACTQDGRLWMLADGDLYSVAAGAPAQAIGAGELMAVAAMGSGLLGVEADPLTFRPSWVEVDLADASTTAIAELEAPLPGTPVGMDLDASGNLWVLTFELPIVTIPPIPTRYEVLLATDLESGAFERRSSYDTAGTTPLRGFAIAAGPFDRVLEVPTLGGGALALLATLLALAGAGLLARARRG